MKRVLILADFLYPEVIGGSARMATDINTVMHENGYDILVCTRKKTGYYTGFESTSRPYKVKMGIKNIFDGLSDFFTKYDKTIIHHYLCGILIMFFLKPGRVIYFFHGPVGLEYRAKGGSWLIGKIKSLVEYIVLKKADDIVCLSEYIKQYVPLSLQDKVCVVGPINNIANKHIKNRFDDKTSIPIKLLTVRRFTARTGILELIELVNQLENSIELVIVGTGELEEEVRKRAKKHIKIVTKVSDEILNQLYLKADLCVLPSIEIEGFGLVIIEALLNSTPVLASSRAGGGADFLKQFSENFIYDIKNTCSEAFLISVTNAINAYRNTQLRNSMVSELKKYSLDNFVQRFI